MTKWRLVAAAAAAAFAVGSAPASAQFFLQSKGLTGQPVRGDEPGVLSVAMPGATPEELRAGLIWTMRAGLNVAALQCQFAPTLNTVRNYNALLLDHKDELKKSFDTVDKYFKRSAKTLKLGQQAFDQFNTKTYSSFATVNAQLGFCQTAALVGRDANFAPRGHLGEIALERMMELRNSLLPFGEQRFPQYFEVRVAALTPRLDKVCWNRRGEWQAKKCGAPAWPTGAQGIGLAAR